MTKAQICSQLYLKFLVFLILSFLCGSSGLSSAQAQEPSANDIETCHIGINPLESSFLDIKDHVLGITCPQLEFSLDEVLRSVTRSSAIPPVQLLRGSEYYWTKMFLLYNLRNMQKRYTSGPLSAEDQHNLDLIEDAIFRIDSNKLPIAIMTGKETTAGILRFEYGDTPIRALILNQDFYTRLFNNPGEMQGILVQELQHLHDIETLPSDDFNLRISSRHESRGHLAMVNYWKRLPKKAKSVSGSRIMRTIAASVDASHGPEWRTYLDSNQGVDFNYLDRFELEALTLIESGNSDKFYKDFLLNEAQEILRVAEELRSGYIESAFQSVPGMDLHESLAFENPERLATLRRQFRTVQTYLKAATTADNWFRDLNEELNLAELAIRKNWETIHRNVFSINDQLAGYIDFLKLQDMNPTKKRPSLSDLGRKNFSQFKQWFENYKDESEIRLLELCEETLQPTPIAGQPKGQKRSIATPSGRVPPSIPRNKLPPKPERKFVPAPIDNNSDRTILTSKETIEMLENVASQHLTRDPTEGWYSFDEKDLALAKIKRELKESSLEISDGSFLGNPLLRFKSGPATYRFHFTEENSGRRNRRKGDPVRVQYISKTQAAGSRVRYDRKHERWFEAKIYRTWLYYENGSPSLYNGDKENTAQYSDVFGSAKTIEFLEKHANETMVLDKLDDGFQFWNWKEGQKLMPLMIEFAKQGIYFDTGSQFATPLIQLTHNHRDDLGYTNISIWFEVIEEGGFLGLGKTNRLRVRTIKKETSKLIQRDSEDEREDTREFKRVTLYER